MTWSTSFEKIEFKSASLGTETLMHVNSKYRLRLNKNPNVSKLVTDWET